MINRFGYFSESHQITTEDGYILTLHRISSTSGQNNTKRPVLLFPGLFSSSADFVVLGKTSLGLLLASDGYDVWLGNQRGSAYGRQHISIDPDRKPKKFFNFSFHEIGIYDLPASIDYIRNVTKNDKIFFIGHSQGGQSFFVLNSIKTEYNDRIVAAVGLAPTSYQFHTRSILFRFMAIIYDYLEEYLNSSSIYEVLPHSELISILAQFVCNTLYQSTNICLWIVKFTSGFDDLIKPSLMPLAFTNFPAGGSAKQILHKVQLLRHNRFSQYDYGPKRNLKRYRQITPPLYNLSQITIPVLLITSPNDLQADYRDVKRAGREIPNAIVKYAKSPKFNHLEFIWSYKAHTFVYSDVIYMFEKYK